VRKIFDASGLAGVNYPGRRRRPRQLSPTTGRSVRLAADGGVKVENIRAISNAGADTFVAGSAIFNAPRYRHAIESMRSELAR